MISAPVNDFLRKYIDSAELLDVLMLLQREPEADWTAHSVSGRVFSVPQAAERRLQELCARGLAAERSDRPGSYTLRLADPKIAGVLAEVRAAYDANRAEVIGVIFKAKVDPIKSFSDAFKLRGDA